jgi:hypothetical protein
MPLPARLLPCRALLRQSAAGFGLLGLRAMLAAVWGGNPISVGTSCLTIRCTKKTRSRTPCNEAIFRLTRSATLAVRPLNH